MPYPTQITREALIATARALIEQHGVEAVSLRVVAEALGVKAPSLYRLMADKETLLRAVNEVTLQKLFVVLYAAIDTPDPAAARLLNMLQAYRHFAHAAPITYELAFTSALRPAETVSVAAVLPLQALMAEISGEAASLAALRGALAVVHGWVMLELNQQFQRGGDLDVHFTQAVNAYLAGWQR
jgi:AcrR family transcriptional regulator